MIFLGRTFLIARGKIDGANYNRRTRVGERKRAFYPLSGKRKEEAVLLGEA